MFRAIGKKKSPKHQRSGARAGRKNEPIEDGTQIEREGRTGHRRHGAQRKPNMDITFHMRQFCLAAVAIGIQGLIDEFRAIKAASVPTAELVKTAFDKNADKNRYRDVYCLDKTRVVLKYPAQSDDYIHANWVDGVGAKQRFICTQAPLDNTVDDFWRMIWQEGCKLILMLCSVMECGRRKCEQYWPLAEGEAKRSGNLKITCTKVMEDESVLTISSLTVTDGAKSLQVEHIAWKDWPDRGIPDNFLLPFRLIKRMKNQMHVVIHCSAGIGRTGTIVALDIVYNMFKSGAKVTLRDVIRELRLQRHGSVQTDVQYLYIHRCFMALLESKKLIKKEEIAPFLTDFDAYIARKKTVSKK